MIMAEVTKLYIKSFKLAPPVPAAQKFEDFNGLFYKYLL